MIKVNVIFNFESVEKWIEFRDNIRHEEKFTRCFTFPQEMLQLNEPTLPFQDREDINDNLHHYSSLYSISTRSKKTLKKLNEWVKDNHYESNYILFDIYGDGLGTSLDELFELYDKSN